MPAVAADKAVPLPLSTPVMLVDKVSAGVAPPLDEPAKPLADTTDTAVTVPNALSPPPLGGPICKSSSDVMLLPEPVKSNRFRKKRYH